jgi:hypothetical protein
MSPICLRISPCRHEPSVYASYHNPHPGRSSRPCRCRVRPTIPLTGSARRSADEGGRARPSRSRTALAGVMPYGGVAPAIASGFGAQGVSAHVPRASVVTISKTKRTPQKSQLLPGPQRRNVGTRTTGRRWMAATLSATLWVLSGDVLPFPGLSNPLLCKGFWTSVDESESAARGWGSRGRRFKSCPPDRVFAGQKRYG